MASYNHLQLLLALAFLISCGQSNKSKVTDLTTQTKKANSGYCAPTLVGDYITDKPAPVFEGLDYFKFPITTDSKIAQMYFNQGWALAAGFNHAEAARSFYWATQEDPGCAMCYWGIAYVLGPNYNAGMDPSVANDATEAIKTALLLSSGVNSRERDLIVAMNERYSEQSIDNRAVLDSNYSQALKALTEKYPDDHDVAALYVESIMDLHPWDLWDKSGNPQPWTNTILTQLSKILAEDSTHAIANHMYIHAVESSTTPSLGNDAAENLTSIAPGAGHLVHMPSHIYIRTGEYKKCTDINIDAVNVDSTYVDACHAAGAYPLAYYPHNFHFICACAALEGNSKLAYDAAIRMQVKLDTEIMREDGWGTIQHYYSIPTYILVKFEMWDEILATKIPDADLIYPKAIMHYARGMAFANKGKMTDAINELAELKTLAGNEKLKTVNVWEINDAINLVEIAQLVLDAEINNKSGNSDNAIAILNKAIVIEDNLNYNEPPDWFFSVRHYLGNIYLETGEPEKARKTFAQDLVTFPNNGWSLHGLYEAQKQLGQQSMAEATFSQFNESWSRADVELEGSRVIRVGIRK